MARLAGIHDAPTATANLYEKLGRHETRLWRLLCSMYKEYERIHRRGNLAVRKGMDP